MMNNITEEELQLLRSTKNSNEWNDACQAIKKAHDGYPIDWYEKVFLSGLTQKIADTWGQPDAFDLKVENLSPTDLGEEPENDSK